MEFNIEKEINKIWSDNPKIPFMQSKEILTFGYKLGLEKSNSNEPIKEKKESKIDKSKNEDTGFTGTTKEFLEHTNKEISKEKSRFGTKESNTQIQYVKTKELDIERARFKLLGEICGYISANRDLLMTYEKLKSMRDVSERNLRTLENKYNYRR